MKIIKTFLPAVSLALIAIALSSCGRKAAAPSQTLDTELIQPVALDPLVLVLTPHEGDKKADKEIRRFQEQVRSGQNRDAALEQMG